MSDNNWQQLKELFHAAIELAPDKRAAFLDDACHGDGEVRSRIETLLASHEDAVGFLISPALMAAGVITEPGEPPPLEVRRIGQRIGPYEIIRDQRNLEELTTRSNNGNEFLLVSPT